MTEGDTLGRVVPPDQTPGSGNEGANVVDERERFLLKVGE